MPQDEVPLYESKGKQWAKAKESNSILGLGPATGGGQKESKQVSFGSVQAHGGTYIPGLGPTEVSIGDLLASSKSKNQKKKKNKSPAQGKGKLKLK